MGVDECAVCVAGISAGVKPNPDSLNVREQTLGARLCSAWLWKKVKHLQGRHTCSPLSPWPCMCVCVCVCMRVFTFHWARVCLCVWIRRQQGLRHKGKHEHWLANDLPEWLCSLYYRQTQAHVHTHVHKVWRSGIFLKMTEIDRAQMCVLSSHVCIWGK